MRTVQDRLFSHLGPDNHSDAVICADVVCSYAQLHQATEQASDWVRQQGIPAGAVVSFDGDYSAPAIALFLALLRAGMIVVPLSADAQAQAESFRAIAQVEYRVRLQTEGYQLELSGAQAEHPLYTQLREAQAPGLVLFSSGSTGTSKAIVQDIHRLLTRYQKPGKPQRMLIFLQLDHIGGVNSLLYTLANGGTLVIATDRSPDAVAAAIASHRVELLPTSPTFLNLLMLSRAHERHDLSPLKLITYGTEPMQPSTLAALNAALPQVTLQQTYGLSEVGILRSRSRDSQSLWMQVGGDSFETRIRNGTLWVKSASAMLGYLNAPSPFDEDGFLDTGDLVEQEGEWLRILGRRSEIINVGGSKVYPAEVESILLELDGVLDAVVYGEPHPITGAIVAARLQLDTAESARQLKARMLRHCREHLPSYKIPGRISISDGPLYSSRYKRLRNPERLRAAHAKEGTGAPATAAGAPPVSHEPPATPVTPRGED